MNGTTTSNKEDMKSLKSSKKLTKQPSSQISKLEKIPLVDRLSIKAKTKLDVIRDKVPRPKGGVPHVAMPAWQTMPLDSKIPRLPGSEYFFMFSRGQLGEPLTRPSGHFDTSNLRNTRAPYTALHDPHARPYLDKPSVKCQLIKQGLITHCEEVICSQKDFNDFRSSMASRHNQKIKDILQQKDKQAKSDREQLRRIKEYERKDTPQDLLYECLALLIEDKDIFDEYLSEDAHKIHAPQPKPKKSEEEEEEPIDWRKQYSLRLV